MPRAAQDPAPGEVRKRRMLMRGPPGPAGLEDWPTGVASESAPGCVATQASSHGRVINYENRSR